MVQYSFEFDGTLLRVCIVWLRRVVGRGWSVGTLTRRNLPLRGRDQSLVWGSIVELMSKHSLGFGLPDQFDKGLRTRCLWYCITKTNKQKKKFETTWTIIRRFYNLTSLKTIRHYLLIIHFWDLFYFLDVKVLYRHRSIYSQKRYIHIRITPSMYQNNPVFCNSSPLVLIRVLWQQIPLFT